MAKKAQRRYVCSHCGWESSQWLGNCASCSKWNTLEEVLLTNDKDEKPHKARFEKKDGAPSRPVALSEISEETIRRTKTGLNEFDRVLGGGLMPGSFVLLGGDPGIGKSTLALQCASRLSDGSILYVSGEESLIQIRQRAGRLGIDSERLFLFTENEVTRVVETAQNSKPSLLIVDSIQTLYHASLQSMPGTMAQIKESASLLMQLAKQEGITVLAIGHVTKDGDLAGPRVLEHMVDTVLQFEGDKQTHHRLLRSLKNRFGPAHEVGVFEMDEKGLKEISNPSELFLSEYNSDVSGNAVVASMEGTRPLLIEVQALVVPASYGTPQRTSSGFDQRRLSLLLAVLEKRCGWEFSRHDVFLNVAGGMKLTETACDLGVAGALVSSVSGKMCTHPTVMIGEIGLGAEVRRVTHLRRRLEEAGLMGFKHAIVPEGFKENPSGEMHIHSVKNISHALRACGLV
ncbi:DNA repair protein RadA [Balneolaceae bacterium ANBcel3]|nr:DNA repair protein RadA [Balneolaceae bacterium ANBcel3]